MAQGIENLKRQHLNKVKKKNVLLLKTRKSLWKTISKTKSIRVEALTYTMFFIELKYNKGICHVFAFFP